MDIIPTFVLVPGAFHLEASMDRLKNHMRSVGCNVESVGLPTVGSPGLSVQDDARFLQQMLLHPLIEQQGKDIVLYLHSYAGLPGSSAIAGYSKEERLAQGKAGGILGLVYQSAYIPRRGDTVLQLSGGDYADWQNPNRPTGLLHVSNPKFCFFADVTDLTATAARDLVRPQSILSFNSQAAQPYYGIADYDNRRIYLRTNSDRSLNPVAQDIYLARSGVIWKVLNLNTGHAPFMVSPHYVAFILVAATWDFLTSYIDNAPLA